VDIPIVDREQLAVDGLLSLSRSIGYEPWHHSTASTVENIITVEDKWQLEEYSSVCITSNMENEVHRLNVLLQHEQETVQQMKKEKQQLLIGRVKKAVEYRKSNVGCRFWSLNDVKDNDNQFKFYTGLTYSQFLSL